MEQEIEKKNIISNINSTQLINEPFPHLLVSNVFSENYYKNLLKLLPSKKNYVSILKTGEVSGNYSPERFVFNLSRENLSKLNHEQESFFKNLVEILMSKELFDCDFKIFNEVIDNRIKNFSQKEINIMGRSNFKIIIKYQLIKDYTKYQLGVHTDTETKLISFLFYLPEDNKMKNIGTSLYKPKSKIEEDDFANHFSSKATKEKFNKVKTCEFIANSVLIFPRTPYSYHGVEEINIDQKERNLLLLNYFLLKD